MSDKPEVPEDDVEMGFFEHLGELRVRLVRAVWGILPGLGVAWYFKERLLEILLDPLIFAYRQNGIEPEIHFQSLLDPFVAYLKISIIAGILSASPWIFWQLWGFLAPGLYRKEKLLAIPFVLASTLFFAGGALFGYFVVFPYGFQTFLEFAGELPSGELRLTPTIMIDAQISLSVRMLLAFGVVFEVPVIVSAISALGLVSWKGLLRFGRWWMIIATVIAALLTPPDVASQLMMLIPLIVLYFLSVGVAFLIDLKRGKAAKAAADEGYER
ncbi:MAG: twin-arginine translocase subunit TatC [Sandaracinus sp.]|nr:twin-arginine translocase subunit TatC [Myxococcales bacterium]MCB9618138.1 twin-arginine translocase subunit TatC [Sandaracinus sp.]MCB9624139.1 twin-arginine translocase subunit TatC [Sandaracinus sp.]